jgi:hypothetical protein
MKTMLWKFYFWVVLALDIMSFVMPQQRRPWEDVDMGLFLVALLGLFGYCWARRIMSRLFWQIFLCCFLIWIGCYAFVIEPLPSVVAQAVRFGMNSRIIIALGILPYAPLIVALYLYSFGKTDVWDEAE